MANNPSNVTFRSLPNKAAIEYIKSKIPAASAHWDDWIAPVHAKSFTVAGAPSVEFAADMHEAVAKVIANGGTITDFRKDFDKIVEKYGWTYKGKRGWRTRVIYNTNMHAAKMAAKWQTIQENKDVAPYLKYSAVLDNHTREQHRAWHDIIRPVDDAFWDTHYPPNGWNCRCTVRAMSEATMKRQGKTVSDAPNINREDRTVKFGKSKGTVVQNIQEGIDVGWDHNVGQSWVAPDVALGKKLVEMPPMMAGHAYQNMVTEPFMRAVSDSWKTNFDAIVQKRNKELFFGYVNNDFNQALLDKADEIIEKTIAFNAKQTARHMVDEPTRESLSIKNLAVLVPDVKQKHLKGEHRVKGVVNPTERDLRYHWEDDWIKDAPLDFHKADYVFYDIAGQTIGVLTEHKKVVDRGGSVHLNS